jgi:hypothetical protein
MKLQFKYFLTFLFLNANLTPSLFGMEEAPLTPRTSSRIIRDLQQRYDTLEDRYDDLNEQVSNLQSTNAKEKAKQLEHANEQLRQVLQANKPMARALTVLKQFSEAIQTTIVGTYISEALQPLLPQHGIVKPLTQALSLSAAHAATRVTHTMAPKVVGSAVKKAKALHDNLQELSNDIIWQIILATYKRNDNLIRIDQLLKRKTILEHTKEWAESFDPNFVSTVNKKTEFFKQVLSNSEGWKIMTGKDKDETTEWYLQTDEVTSKINELEKDISLAQNLINEWNLVKTKQYKILTK